MGMRGGTKGLTKAQADALYVKTAGDTMSGDLEFLTSSIGPILYDGTSYWRVTTDTSGHLITTQVAVPSIGNPMGLLLALTYAA